jgi:hypothetical protein
LALSGSLDRMLNEKLSSETAKQLLSYALDILERHMEKKLISRKTFESGEGGSIEI